MSPLAFSNDEAGLHGRDSEGELLQATRGPHVPVALPAPTPPAPAVSWGSSGLDAPQQVRNDLCRVLRLVGRPHDLCYPVWCAAVVCKEETGPETVQQQKVLVPECELSKNI